MEGLQPQDIEDPLQELEEEDGAEESLAAEIQELLQDLQPPRRPAFRRRAAKQLGEVSRSSRQVVQALMTAAETDSAATVRATAVESLRAPVHQEYLQQHPDLMEAERAVQRKEVTELLHVLQSSSAPLDRRDAAEQLGNVGTSSPRIVQALIAAYESDLYSEVSRAAARSLRAPVHVEYLRQNPDLMEATERALRRRPHSYSSGEPTELAGYLSFLVSLGDVLAGGRPSAWRWISRKEADHRTSHEAETLSYRIGAALGALFARIRRWRMRRLDSVTAGEYEALNTQAGRKPQFGADSLVVYRTQEEKDWSEDTSAGKELSLMEELQPQELEELVQELEGKAGAQESIPQEVEELLRVLQGSSLSYTRRDAAEQLALVGTSSHRIVQALIAAYESDSYSKVNRAAAKSLRAPVHQEYLQQHPDLMEAAEGALKRRAGADKQCSSSDTRGVLLWLGVFSPVLAYEVGVLVGSHISRSMHAFSYSLLEIVYGEYLSLNLICSVPALALSLFLGWFAVVTAQEEKRSTVIVVILICLCTIFTLAVGFGVGMFMNLDLSRY